MPDIDQLLREDAHRSATADGAGSAFGPAFERTLTRARRHRRGRWMALGAAAVAAAGITAGSIAATSTSPSQRSTNHIRLAADYHVISTVHGHPGVLYVIGPPSSHPPAHCRTVPDVTVDVDGIPGRVWLGHVIHTAGHDAPELPAGELQLPNLPPGRYDLFTCRTD